MRRSTPVRHAQRRHSIIARTQILQREALQLHRPRHTHSASTFTARLLLHLHVAPSAHASLCVGACFAIAALSVSAPAARAACPDGCPSAPAAVEAARARLKPVQAQAASRFACGGRRSRCEGEDASGSCTCALRRRFGPGVARITGCPRDARPSPLVCPIATAGQAVIRCLHQRRSCEHASSHAHVRPCTCDTLGVPCTQMASAGSAAPAAFLIGTELGTEVVARRPRSEGTAAGWLRWPPCRRRRELRRCHTGGSGGFAPEPHRAMGRTPSRRRVRWSAAGARSSTSAQRASFVDGRGTMRLAEDVDEQRRARAVTPDGTRHRRGSTSPEARGHVHAWWPAVHAARASRTALASGTICDGHSAASIRTLRTERRG